MSYDRIEADDVMVFDIETTGLSASEGDVVTTIVTHYNNEYKVFLQTDGSKIENDPFEMQEEIRNRSTLENVSLRLELTEEDMLNSFASYVRKTSDNDTVLSAFNGETYHGGFDLGFLRNRFAFHRLAWPFKNMKYCDSYEAIGKNNRLLTKESIPPEVSDLYKNELKDFIEWSDMDIRTGRPNKSDLQETLEQREDIYAFEVDEILGNGTVSLSDLTKTQLIEFAESHNITLSSSQKKNELIDAISAEDENLEESFYILEWADDTENVSAFSFFTAKDIREYIKREGLDITTSSPSKADLVEVVQNHEKFTDDLLRDWCNEVNKELDMSDVSDLDGLHRYHIEQGSESPTAEYPFSVEEFEPFDPFEDSEEAIEAFETGEYVDVILHCLADVARTVNITRLMLEYISSKDYRTKFL